MPTTVEVTQYELKANADPALPVLGVSRPSRSWLEPQCLAIRWQAVVHLGRRPASESNVRSMLVVSGGVATELLAHGCEP